jgi:NAD+ synthase (glutamine-hydrolysing)
MPYPVLDAIERAAIRDITEPDRVLRVNAGRVPGLRARSDRALGGGGFFILWSRNQWKRERYAPSFHLDDEKTSIPRPGVASPFSPAVSRRELAELRDFARTR